MGKAELLRNFLVRLFLFCVLVIALRFAYVVTIRGESCDVGDFCFFALPENFNVVAGLGHLTETSSSAIISSSEKAAPSTPKKIPDLWGTEGFQKSVQFYSSIFQDLLSEAVLIPNFKTLCVDTATGADVFALRELGVEDSIGISKKGFKPLVIPGQGLSSRFMIRLFDFVFCGDGAVEKTAKLGDFVAEIGRTMKPEGFLVVHTGVNDTYSFESFLGLFNYCKLVKSRDINGFDSKIPFIREIVLQKFGGDGDIQGPIEKASVDSGNKCLVSGYKRDLIKKAEPLIQEEPAKPWITLKKNVQKIKYLPSMVDISFKPRYVYVDVGARSYGSSIVSWFKQYPKQNKTFEIFAIEADKTFHGDYQSKKGGYLAALCSLGENESLFFEINEDPGHTHKEVEKGRGMGRIQPVQTSGGSATSGSVDQIQGFDFADWLKKTVSERDYVVMKMDVEGTEFDLIPRLFETGAICLIDEVFLECHYNRWQKCCPGRGQQSIRKHMGSA